MLASMIAGYLRWVDVDPRERPAIDPEAIAAVVRPLVAAAAMARGPRYRDALLEQIDRELLVAFGPWIAGWSWSASEPGGGGPVHAWCCAEHSLFPKAEDPAGGPRTDLADADEDPVSASAARVVAAIVDWQHCLDQLAELFGELREESPLPGPGGERAEIQIAVERAASRLLPWVIERTHAEDAWYGTFAKLLAWYVESAGYEIEYARVAISNAIDGKFLSWMEPTPEVARATTAELGRVIAKLAHETTQTDATAIWIAQRRGSFSELERIVHVPVRADGHQRYIDTRDHARDPERAERMSAALMLCRDSARRGMRLTFDQLCEWQAAVLGESRVELRTGPAFAKRGREVYPLRETTRRQLEEALAESGTGRIAIRAARVYLDVCFFHPFADGNARAARLALDHVLTSEGYGLHVADPVFIVSRTIEDRLVGWSLARVLDRLIGPMDAARS
jgi:hypothetical protein